MKSRPSSFPSSNVKRVPKILEEYTFVVRQDVSSKIVVKKVIYGSYDSFPTEQRIEGYLW